MVVRKMEARLEKVHNAYAFLHVWHRFFMLSRCLSTKFMHRSSGGSLLRVRCWLGSCCAWNLKYVPTRQSVRVCGVWSGMLNTVCTSFIPDGTFRLASVTNLRKKIVAFMWCSNDMFFFITYMFKAEFVTLVSLKVPSGCGWDQTFFLGGGLCRYFQRNFHATSILSSSPLSLQRMWSHF